MGSTNQIDPVQLQKAWYQLARRHAALRTILVEAALEDVEGGTLTHVVLDSYPREVKIICCTDDEAMHVLRHPTLNSRDNAGLFFRMSLLSAKPIRPRVFSWVSYALSLAECMDFWLEYLAGAKPCHFPRLPREIQPVTDFLNSVEVSLGHPSPPRKLCALNGLTITNLLQIAWGVVLRQHTSSDDVCFGTLLTLSENMSLRECLQENQVAMASRLSNQYCSLFGVMQRIDSTRSLFNTCLSVEQPLSNSNRKEPGVHFGALETCEATEYDIVTVVTVGEAEMTANITYWSSVLTREQAIAVGRDFRLAISTITEHIR
ncbi:uncharacterized protein TERG_12487 [Trichophyton rubrum CBS 118892]|uniref:Condensation domain-containing protein n=3 Tax=Trichophyton TaxID=5550 RepID=A0A080WIN3_TRIRC|nr:uncharacterized protein TERG_12487 [Trichophyton rubrum CBS 118892]KFL62526.1 hypothetical protein TERG_12487 [Trichophyton rubrum CBS 118892]